MPRCFEAYPFGIWILGFCRSNGRLLLAPISHGLVAFLGGNVTCVRGNAPLMPEWIDELPIAIAPEHIGWWHYWLRAFPHRFVKGGVHVADVNEHARWRSCAAGLRRQRSHLRIFIAQHQHVIANFDLRMRDFWAVRIIHAHQFSCAEPILVELDSLVRLANPQSAN